MKMTRLFVTLLAILILGISAGCGKKEPPPVTDEVVFTPPDKLPELEQNKMYLNNPVVSGPQDTSFEPAPTGLQEITQEERDLMGPPVD